MVPSAGTINSPAAARFLDWLGQFKGYIPLPQRVQLVVLLAMLVLAAWSGTRTEGHASVQSGGRVATGQQPGRLPVLPTQQVRVATGDPLQLITLYNAASISAGLTGDPAPLQPFFASGSSAWAAVQQEFTRRAQSAETHAATLVRWGIVQQEWSATAAQIETQEQWDDATYRHGKLVDAQRGILLRLRYYLQRQGPDAPWLITTIDSTTVIR